MIDHLASAAIAFSVLPRQHPSELDEFERAIHQAQLLVMARFARRHEASGLTPAKGAPACYEVVDVAGGFIKRVPVEGHDCEVAGCDRHPYFPLSGGRGTRLSSEED